MRPLGWKKSLLLGGVIFAISCGVFAWWYLAQKNIQTTIGGRSYITAVMRTDAEQEKGLSGTASLPGDHAMLFVYPYESQWGIWMKDMHYPIDIVWMNNDREVVHMVSDAKPSSYPNTIFSPEKSAQYVLELPAGTVEKSKITVGDKVNLPTGV